MATYRVTDPTTGKSLRLTGDSPPTEQELNDIFSTVHGTPAQAPAVPPSTGDNVLNAIKKGYQMGNPISLAQNIGRPALQMIQKAQNALGDKTTELATNAGAGPKLAALAGTAAYMAPDIATAAMSGGESKVPMLEDASRNMAQRALGFSKRFLNTPSARRKATVAAETALQNNVIPLSGDPAVMMSRATSLANQSGKALGSIRDAAGDQSVSKVIDALNSLKGRLTGGETGGEFDAIAGRIDHAIETVKGSPKPPTRLMQIGESPSAESLSRIDPYSGAGNPPDLSPNLGLQKGRHIVVQNGADLNLGGRVPDQMAPISKIERAKKVLADTVNWLTDSPGKQSQMKSIVGTIEGTVEDLLRKSGADMGAYQKAKTTFGAAKAMQMGLNNELSSQTGNQLLSLKPMIAVGGELAAGNPLGAAATAVGSQIVKNRGAGTAAVLLRQASRSKLGLLTAPGMAALESVKNGGAMTNGAQQMTKTLSLEKAMEYLKQARGDKNKARQLATNDGWQIPE